MKAFLLKICRKIYLFGKVSYEKSVISSLYKKGMIDSSVRFTLTANLQNLSNDLSSISIGKESNIEGLILVHPFGGNIKIGEYCSLSIGSRIISTEKIIIGNRVLIAHNVNIIDNNSHPIDADMRHLDYKESFSIGMQKHDLNGAPIIIEDDVWIGHNTTILKGVTIGKGAIIGACSVVTKNIAPWTVNVGNPLRVIKNLEKKIENNI